MEKGILEKLKLSLSDTRAWLRAGLVAFLLSPFLTLFYYLERWKLPPGQELLDSLIFTFEQAFLSALFSLLIGTLGALGLLYWRQRRRILEILFLIPNLIPTLFVILAGLKFIDPFPFGLWGIVILHTLINSGLASVAIAHILESQVAGWAELALVEGSSRWHFFKVTLKFLKRDLALVFLFVFAICFSSLTIPLVAGGFDATTTEVLIFEKIHISGQWDEALGISALQTLIIFSLTLMLVRPTPRSNELALRDMSLLTLRAGVLLPLLFSLSIVLSQFTGLAQGLKQIQSQPAVLESLKSAVWGTGVVGLGVGLLTFFLLGLIVYALPNMKFQNFLLGYIAPSSVLTGFALLLLPLGDWTLFKMISGITLIQLPFFYRLYVDTKWDQVQNQVLVARTLGASWPQIFNQITFPQTAQTLASASGLAALWACGEFALSSVVTGQEMTLALMTKKLLGSYRLEVATVLVWCMMISGAILWFVFWRTAHVFGRKSLS